MTTTKNQKSSNKNTKAGEQTAEVLYQKLGSRWFAFSLIDDEVFVGSLTPEEIRGETGTSNEKIFKFSGKA